MTNVATSGQIVTVFRLLLFCDDSSIDKIYLGQYSRFNAPVTHTLTDPVDGT